jgi:ABC exporter DevB family membrane fusion protein
VLAVLLCAASLAAGGAAGYSLHRLDNTATRTVQPPPDPEARSLSALGQVQPADGVITIYGPPGDRILKFAEPLHPGQTVKAGTPLVILASQKAHQKELALAETQLNQARQQQEAIRKAADAKLEELETETNELDNRKKEDLAIQDARIQVLRAQEGEARNQLRRLEGLSGQRVPPTEMDQARLAVDVAKGQLEGAQATRTETLNTYRRQSDLAKVKKKVILAERDQALQQVPVEAAEQSQRLAQLRLDECTLKVPDEVGTGTVLRVPGHAGEVTGTQPILELAAGEPIVVVAEVYEDDLDRLYNGLKKPEGVSATVQARALEGSRTKPLTGHVEPDQIARLVVHNQLLSLNPRADHDQRVVQVRVLLDPESAERARKIIGLQVNVLLKP